MINFEVEFRDTERDLVTVTSHEGVLQIWVKGTAEDGMMQLNKDTAAYLRDLINKFLEETK